MIIVKTLDNKMLQDTVVGKVLAPRRPNLTENSSFIETRRVANEYRPAELEVLVSDFTPNEDVTDETLGDDFVAYKNGLKKNEKVDIDGFVEGWASKNGSVKKGVDKKAAEEKAAKDAAAAAAKEGKK